MLALNSRREFLASHRADARSSRGNPDISRLPLRIRLTLPLPAEPDGVCPEWSSQPFRARNIMSLLFACLSSAPLRPLASGREIIFVIKAAPSGLPGSGRRRDFTLHRSRPLLLPFSICLSFGVSGERSLPRSEVPLQKRVSRKDVYSHREATSVPF